MFNLSSITVLATFKKKTMLLTGDARGDYVLAGLRRAKLLKNGKIHVNLLKIPHHGSDNNVDTDFFRSITADHYVVSGDGEHGNPEVSTFQMISDARGQDEFTIYLTHGKLPEDPKPNKLLDFFRNEKQAGKKYKTAVREEDRWVSRWTCWRDEWPAGLRRWPTADPRSARSSWRPAGSRCTASVRRRYRGCRGRCSIRCGA